MMNNIKISIKKIIILCVSLLIGCNLCNIVSYAVTPTTYTMTPTAEGDGFAITQSAYQVSNIYSELGLNNAEDMVVYGDTAYIADSGNHRVVILDLLTGKYNTIGEDILNNPTGVAVDKEGRIYVADYTNCEAYRFSANGDLEQTFQKPDTPKFGIKSKFIPRKIAAVGDGGVYLIVEGAAGGIVYMGTEGKFVSYYASNLTQVDLFRKFLDVFLTEKQLDTFMKKTPDSYGNLMVDGDGLLYTINIGEHAYIQKHSMNGSKVTGLEDKQQQLEFVVDIAMDTDGNMFALDKEGHVVEMTSEGIWLCVFGNLVDKSDRVGLFETPSGVGVDESGNLYILDKTRNMIQKFTPTVSQEQIHKAISTYNSGDYKTAGDIFSQILKTNESSSYAHFYMGRIEMYNQNYTTAAEHFKVSYARKEYSEAFWEIRNQWLIGNMKYIVGIVGILLIFIRLCRTYFKSFNIGFFKSNLRMRNLRFCKDFSWLKEEIKHPIDNAYEISIDNRGNYATSTFIYLLVFVCFTVYRLCSGFIFSATIEDFPLLVYLGGYVATLALLLVGNTLISSIQDSRGTFKSIFVSTSYSMVPLLIAFPIMTVLNNLFTYNEQFICQLILIVAIIWTVVIFTLAQLKVHDYSFGKFVKIIFFTIVFMLVAILLISLFYLLAQQIVDFVLQVYTEVMIRD